MSHAPFSPSAAHRWMACPGSYLLEAPFPDTESEWSREGTFFHEVAEHLLRSHAPAREALGRRDKTGELEVTAEDLPHLQAYLDAVRSAVLLHSGDLQVERKVHLTPDCWGTADALVISLEQRRIDVFDLKWGAGVLVSAWDNPQLKIYGAAALAGLPPEQQKQVDTVGLHIVQPRAGDGTPQHYEISVADLAAFVVQVERAIDAAQDDKAELVPGAHCRFCKAASTCPRLQKDAAQRMQQVHEIATVDTSEIAALLTQLPQLETWIRAVRERAHQLAQTGVEMPGFKLVEKVGNRQWLDPVDAVRALDAAGVDPWTPQEPISPAQAEKKLGKAGKELIAGLTHRPRNGTALVPDTDKRPAITAPSVAVFKTLANPESSNSSNPNQD